MAAKKQISAEKAPVETPQKTKRISKTNKAGLTMPVSRIQRYLKKGRFAKRISVGAAVYMTSVIEYIVAEITELAGNAAKANKKKTVTPRYIMLGVRNDEELNQLFAHGHIAGGGVVPKVHPFICPRKSISEEQGEHKVSQEY